MDTVIIAAIIGGVLGILAALIGVYPHLRSRSSRNESANREGLAKDRSQVGFPCPRDPEQLTRREVHQLVEFYGLFRRWRTNSHLMFLDGDVSYWHEQDLNLDDLCREFSNRRAVLEQAEESGESIATQGDLSALSQGSAKLEPTNRQTTGTDLNLLRVLIVEDHPDDVMLFRRMIRRNKWPVGLSVALDGSEALDALLPPSGARVAPLPDLIILDLGLPHITGFEVLERLRADPQLRGIPVVVHAVSQREGDRVKAFELGAEAYICKGLDRGAELEALIARHLVARSNPAE